MHQKVRQENGSPSARNHGISSNLLRLLDRYREGEVTYSDFAGKSIQLAICWDEFIFRRRWLDDKTDMVDYVPEGCRNGRVCADFAEG